MVVDEENTPEIPSPNICDPQSGYSASIPATQQGYPGWWIVEPETYQRILEIRKTNGIEVDDGIEVHDAS